MSLYNVTGLTNFVEGLYSISQKEYKKMATNFAMGSLKLATWVVVANVAMNAYQTLTETDNERDAHHIANLCYQLHVTNNRYAPGHEMHIKKDFDYCVDNVMGAYQRITPTMANLTAEGYNSLLNLAYSYYKP